METAAGRRPAAVPLVKNVIYLSLKKMFTALREGIYRLAYRREGYVKKDSGGCA